MFNVGDKVIVKLDYWKYLKCSYKFIRDDLPEDSPIFYISRKRDINTHAYDYYIKCELYDLTDIVKEENLLKAP